MRRTLGAVTLGALVLASGARADDKPVDPPSYHVKRLHSFLKTVRTTYVKAGDPVPHEIASSKEAGEEAAKEKLEEIADKLREAQKEIEEGLELQNARSSGGIFGALMTAITRIEGRIQVAGAKARHNSIEATADEDVQAARETGAAQHNHASNCLAGDTEVALASGGRVALAALFDGSAPFPEAQDLRRAATILVRDAEGLPRWTRFATRSPFHGPLVVVDAGATRLELTPNHEVLVLRGSALAATRAGELRLGDRLALGGPPAVPAWLLPPIALSLPRSEPRTIPVGAVGRREHEGFVYNLVLEGPAPSFVARGLGVLGLAR